MIDTDQGQRIARTRHALTIAPDVIAHIVAQRGEPTRSTQPRVQQSKEPPAPLNVDAVDDSDYVYQSLTYWAGVFVNALGAVGPVLLRQARRTQDGTIVGFPSAITPSTAHDATRAVTAWMLERLDRLASERPFELQEFATDIGHVHSLRAKWPIEEGGTQSQVPCPHHDGDKVPIVIYSPLEYGMPRVIVCDRSHYFDEDGFADAQRSHVDSIMQQVTQARKDKADRERGARVMQHLLDTYGT